LLWVLFMIKLYMQLCEDPKKVLVIKVRLRVYNISDIIIMDHISISAENN